MRFKWFKIIFSRIQIIKSFYNVIHGRIFINGIIFMICIIICLSHKGFHNGAKIRISFFNSQRIGRQCIFLHIVNIFRKSLRHCVNQCDTYYTDTSCEGSKRGTAFFGNQIFQRKQKWSPKRHGRFLFIFFLFLWHLILNLFQLYFFFCKRNRIISKRTVKHTDNSCRIFFSKLGIMGNHNNQPILGYFLEYFHYLYTGFGIQCTCRLISQNYIRIIYKRSCNWNTLHLSAGHLAWFLVKLISQSYFFQSFFCTLFSLCFRNAWKSKRKLNVLQYCLMWY